MSQDWPSTPGPREWGLLSAGNPGSYPGRVVKVRPGELGVQVLDLRDSNNADASQVTVSLSYTRSGNKQNALRTPFAHIDFGVSGGRDSVDIDWIHGQLISVPTTFLRVTASFPANADSVNPPGFPPETLPAVDWGPSTKGLESEELLLGCSVGSGSHGTPAFGTSPRLTTYHRVLGATTGVSDYVPIPSHAQSVTVCSPVPCTITAFTRAAIGSALYASAIGAPNLDQFAFPIARGVEFVQLSNAGPNNVLALLLWTIGL